MHNVLHCYGSVLWLYCSINSFSGRSTAVHCMEFVELSVPLISMASILQNNNVDACVFNPLTSADKKKNFLQDL